MTKFNEFISFCIYHLEVSYEAYSTATCQNKKKVAESALTHGLIRSTSKLTGMTEWSISIAAKVTCSFIWLVQSCGSVIDVNMFVESRYLIWERTCLPLTNKHLSQQWYTVITWLGMKKASSEQSLRSSFNHYFHILLLHFTLLQNYAWTDHPS